MKKTIKLLTLTLLNLLLPTALFAVNAQGEYDDVVIDNILNADQSAFKTTNNYWHAYNNNGNGTLSYNNGQLEFNVTNHGQNYQPQLELSNLDGKIKEEEYYVRFTAYVEGESSAKVDFICQDTYHNGYFQAEIADIELSGTEKTYTLKFAKKLDTSCKHIIFNVGHTNCKYIFKSIEFGQALPVAAPTFTKNLKTNYEVYPGDKLTLNVEATGVPVPTYQWYYANGTEIEGATSSSYTVPSSTIGTTQYYCIASNSQGTITSTYATVEVTESADTGTWYEIDNTDLLYQVKSNELIVKGEGAIPDYTQGTGTVTLADFENNNISNVTMERSQGSNATVTIVDDGTGRGGKVLKYTTDRYKQGDYVRFDFNLGNNKLSDFSTVKFFMYVDNFTNYGHYLYYKLDDSNKKLSETELRDLSGSWHEYEIDLPKNDNKAFSLYIGGLNCDPDKNFYFDDFSLTGGSQGFNHPWQSEKGNITKVTVRKGVTSIGENAFVELNLTDAEIGSSVEEVKANAFDTANEACEFTFHSNPVIDADAIATSATRVLVLNDSDKPYMSNAENKYSSITYNRNINTEFFTLVLPFTPDASEIEGLEFYELSSADTEVITFTLAEEVVANKPYLVKAIDNTPIALYAEEMSVSPNPTEADGWTMTPVYQTVVKHEEDNVYGLFDNVLYHNTGNMTVAPFRAYISYTGTNHARSAMNISFSNETTAINATNTADKTPASIFSLGGEQLSTLHKGINIIKFTDGSTKTLIIK